MTVSAVLPGYVTADRRRPCVESAATGDKTTVKHGSSLVVHSGRPNFDSIVEAEVDATAYEE